MNLLEQIPFQHAGYLVADREAACRQLEKIYGLDQWTMVEYKPLKATCYGKPFDGYYVKAAVHPPVGGCGIPGCGWSSAPCSTTTWAAASSSPSTSWPG